jgi:ABC-type Na+ efflux pump permease subunit
MLLGISTIIVFYLLFQTIYKIATNQLFLTNVAAEKATRILEPLSAK